MEFEVRGNRNAGTVTDRKHRNSRSKAGFYTSTQSSYPKCEKIIYSVSLTVKMVLLRPSSLIAKLILMGLVFGAVTMIQWQKRETQLRQEISQQSDLDGTRQRLIHDAIDKISLGYLGDARQRAAELEFMIRDADALAKKSRLLAALLFSALILFAITMTFVFIRSSRSDTSALVDLVMISVITLILGITLPMISIAASTEIWGVGNVILKSETKSIMGTIKSLWLAMPFIAILITLFSIVTPAAKSLMLILAHVFPNGRSHSILHHVGKWSMADVFVVAIFISYFALDQKNLTDANLGWGLWFFLTYCLLSMAISVMLGRLPPERLKVYNTT